MLQQGVTEPCERLPQSLPAEVADAESQVVAAAPAVSREGGAHSDVHVPPTLAPDGERRRLERTAQPQEEAAGRGSQVVPLWGETMTQQGGGQRQLLLGEGDGQR